MYPFLLNLIADLKSSNRRRTSTERHRRRASQLAGKRFRPQLTPLEDRLLPSVSVINQFDGMGNKGSSNPDTNAAAGPSHVVEVINQSIAIYDKATGNSLSQQYLSDFFSVPGGGLAAFDPVVSYDDLANRFVVAALANDTSAQTSTLLVAWSKTSDPTSKADFNQLKIDLAEHDASGKVLGGDFDRLGWNANDYVFAVNMITLEDNAHDDPNALRYGRILTLDKSSLTNPNPQPFDTGAQLAQFGTTYTYMTPAVMHGASPNDPMWLVQPKGYNMMDVGEMTNTHSTLPTFTQFCVTVGAYTYTAPTAADPGGALDTADTVHSVEWRGGMLVAAHSVGITSDKDVHARWYEFNTNGVTPTNGVQPTLYQQGTLIPGQGISTWFPSIAIAPDGSLGMTYLESSSTEYLSMYITGWNSKVDPLNVDSLKSGMENPIAVQTGLDVLNSDGMRSGDYSSTTVDPTDGTFWAANEYAIKSLSNIDSNNWGTHIAHFKLDAKQLPAWSQQSGGTLTIDGKQFGAGNQSLSIDATAQGNLVVTLNNLLEVLQFPPGQVTAINVNSLGSNNTIKVSAETQNVNFVPTINVNGAIGALTVHGGGNAVLTVNDQANPSSASTQYTLTSGSLTRTVAYPASQSHPGIAVTTTINYDNLKILTLNAGNNGPNTVNIESTAVKTYVNGGSATSQVNIAPTSQNLDNIAVGLTISGGAGSLNVYDQANPHGASSYSVSYGITRTAPGSAPVGINAFYQQKSITLYTGKAANQVTVASVPVPTTINSGGADAITVTAYAVPTTSVLTGTVSYSSQLTVNANGGTLTIDQRALQNDPLDTFSDAFTVTDQAIARNGHWHKVIKQINDPEVPHNPADPPPPNGATLDVNFIDTLSYQNVKGLTIKSGPITSTFNMLSTPAGVPLAINGGNQFIVGANGSVKNIRSQLTLNGTGSNATLLVDDSQATLQDKLTVTASQVGAAATDQFFGAGGSLTYGSMSSLTLNLSKAANDKVQVAPSAATAFFINANGSGAELDLDLTGVTNAQETLTSPGTGKFAFGNRQAVSFKNMGTVKTL